MMNIERSVVLVFHPESNPEYIENRIKELCYDAKTVEHMMVKDGIDHLDSGTKSDALFIHVVFNGFGFASMMTLKNEFNLHPDHNIKEFYWCIEA